MLPDKQEIIIILSKRKKPERAARKPAGRIPWRLSENPRGGYPGGCPETRGEDTLGAARKLAVREAREKESEERAKGKNKRKK